METGKEGGDKQEKFKSRMRNEIMRMVKRKECLLATQMTVIIQQLLKQKETGKGLISGKRRRKELQGFRFTKV